MPMTCAYFEFTANLRMYPDTGWLKKLCNGKSCEELGPIKNKTLPQEYKRGDLNCMFRVFVYPCSPFRPSNHVPESGPGCYASSCGCLVKTRRSLKRQRYRTFNASVCATSKPTLYRNGFDIHYTFQLINDTNLLKETIEGKFLFVSQVSHLLHELCGVLEGVF